MLNRGQCSLVSLVARRSGAVLRPPSDSPLGAPAQVSLLPPVAAIAATAVAGPSADALIARGWPVARVRRLAQATAFLGPAACLTAAAFSEDGPQTVGAPLLQRGWRAGMHLGWNALRSSAPGWKRMPESARALLLWHPGCHLVPLCMHGGRNTRAALQGAHTGVVISEAGARARAQR
jgi:hypothetical protein